MSIADHSRFAFRKNVTALLTFAKHESDEPSGEQVFQNLWLGCTIAAFANIIIAAGLNVQKYTHNHLTAQQQQQSMMMANGQNQTPPGNSASSCAEHAAVNQSTQSMKYWRFPLWWLGIFFLVVGEMGNFVAYGVAPASAIAPLGITCVIANVAIARLFLKETLRATTLIGSGIGVSGAVLLVLFIAKENDTILDPRGVEAAVTQPYFVLYLTGLAVALVVLFLMYYIQRTKSLLVILFIGNILAAITVITAKAVSGFVVLFLRGSLPLLNLITSPVLYFLVTCVIITGITQVKYVQDALAIYPATFVVPVNYILFTLSAITAGIIFYGELLGLGEVNVIIFIVGCVLCFAGVFLITNDGRACAMSQQQTSQIGEMTTSYGGAATGTSSAGASTVQGAANNQNRVMTLLRDCVKITQTKFELQPLLHSSPTVQQQQLNALQKEQLQQQKSASDNQQDKTLLATSQTMNAEPSPISKHMLSIAMSGVKSGATEAPNMMKSTSFATLSPAHSKALDSAEKASSGAKRDSLDPQLQGDSSLTIVDETKQAQDSARTSPASIDTESCSVPSNSSQPVSTIVETPVAEKEPEHD